MFRQLRFRLHRIKRPQRYQLLTPLLAQQTWDRTALLRKQREDLFRLVHFAAGHTEYYKRRYAGQLPDQAQELDISRLPILRKEDVIKQREQMLSDTCDRQTIRLGFTGGSTGNPLSFYYDTYKMELMRAGMARSYMWSGWRPGEKILNFWGAKQDLKKNRRLNTAYSEFIAAEKTIGAWEYGEAELHRWVRFIKRYRPVLIQGYASIIADVAAFALENKIAMPSSLKGVYSTAEILHDWQREQMQRAFNCQVYNQYGCREIPNIGLECQQGNIHVFTDMVQLESVNMQGEDKLLITSLTNFLMPMIRYENGDNGKLKSGRCGCGSAFPMMEMGVCRSNDFIKTRAGKKIAPSYFNRLLDGVTGIKQYQFVQTEWDKLNLNIQADSRLERDSLNSVGKKIRQDIDQGLQLEINYLDRIERSRSGKHRFVICELD